MTSHSKPGPIQLKPYEFSPEDLQKLVIQYESVDPNVDIKAAKKACTALKKKINEVKNVHTHNKKVILTFKRDLESYDLSKFQELTENLQKVYDRIHSGITTIEGGKAAQIAGEQEKIDKIQLELTNRILSATSKDEIHSVLADIHAVDPTDFIQHMDKVISIRTSLTLKAGAREVEINKLEKQGTTVLPATPLNSSNVTHESDSKLLDFLEASAIPGRGWKCMISSHTGPSIYQVEDPSAPLSIRTAIQLAYEEMKQNSL